LTLQDRLIGLFNSKIESDCSRFVCDIFFLHQHSYRISPALLMFNSTFVCHHVPGVIAA
jgi:hypothetical protein